MGWLGKCEAVRVCSTVRYCVTHSPPHFLPRTSLLLSRFCRSPRIALTRRIVHCPLFSSTAILLLAVCVAARAVVSHLRSLLLSTRYYFVLSSHCNMPPFIAVACSDSPACITSHFHVCLGHSDGVYFDPAILLHATRIRQGAAAEVALKGRVVVRSRPGRGGSVLPKGVGEDVRLVFEPCQTDEDGLHVGDVVCIALAEEGVWSVSGLVPVSSCLPPTRHSPIARHTITPVHIVFDGHPYNTRFSLSVHVAHQPEAPAGADSGSRRYPSQRHRQHEQQRQATAHAIRCCGVERQRPVASNTRPRHTASIATPRSCRIGPDHRCSTSMASTAINLIARSASCSVRPLLKTSWTRNHPPHTQLLAFDQFDLALDPASLCPTPSRRMIDSTLKRSSWNSRMAAKVVGIERRKGQTSSGGGQKAAEGEQSLLWQNIAPSVELSGMEVRRVSIAAWCSTTFQSDA